jgi:uncharacterized cupredoxin-like copper-binding protein
MTSLSFPTLRRTVAPVLAALLLGLAVPLAASSADSPQQVGLKATEFSFTPGSVTVKVGQPVQLTIENVGTVDHDLKSDIPLADLTYQQADNPPDEQQEASEEGTLDIDFNVGHSAQVTFVPTQPGTYAFFCDLPGHRESGMEGTFVVGS